MNIGSSKSELHTRRYLTNMFTDRDLIKLPFQSILGRFIAFVATKNSIRKHRLIGGYSHVIYWTEIQAEMLREYLDYHSPETGSYKIYSFSFYNLIIKHYFNKCN